jgi:hypothetical protein
MKKYVLVIGLALIISFLMTCNAKEESEVESYNPYDTSEMEDREALDTIYSLDSVIRTIHLRELK